MYSVTHTIFLQTVHSYDLVDELHCLDMSVTSALKYRLPASSLSSPSHYHIISDSIHMKKLHHNDAFDCIIFALVSQG